MAIPFHGEKNVIPVTLSGLTATTTTILPTATAAGKTVWLSALVYDVTTTGAAGEQATFDSTVTDTPIIILDEEGVGTRSINFGPDGYPLPFGEGLKVTLVGNAVANIVAIFAVPN